MSKSLSISLILTALLVGIGLGFAAAPPWAAAVLKTDPMAAPVNDAWSDLRFLDAMGPHHRGALALAQAAEKNSQRPELVDFAHAVVALKTSDLEQFAKWKAAWYGDTRPIAAAAPLNLGGADDQFDLRFLNALEGKLVDAIAMANAQRRVSTRTEVLTYCSELIRVQTGVLAQVRQWRKDWYGF